MKTLTSITVWNDAVGKRISMTYSEVNSVGQIVSDNNRLDRVITDGTASKNADALFKYAQAFIDGE